MKERFTPEQIVHVLQQAESGTKVSEICRKMGVRSIPIPNDRWSHYRCEQAALVCLDGWYPPVVANILWSLNYFKY